MEWTIPAFAFPAEAGTHLPTPEGRKAELVLECTYLLTYWPFNGNVTVCVSVAKHRLKQRNVQCGVAWWWWLDDVDVDELMTKYGELSRVREELVQQLNTVTENEKLARANVNATEQANCALPSCISS